MLIVTKVIKSTELFLILLFCVGFVSAQNMKNLKSGYIDIDGGKIYYEVAGEGEYYVMVHDGCLHSVTWNEQFPVFAKNFRVVRYDRRGYGKSLPQQEKPYSNIDDLNEVFKHLDIKSAHVMGMSAGGGLSIDFTLEHPDKVKSLVLVGAVVSGFGYSEHMSTRGGRMSQSIFADPEVLRKYIIMEDPYTFYEKNNEVKEKAWKLLENSLHNFDFSKNNLIQGPKRAALKNLNEIEVPTLIITGEYDIPDCHAHAGAIQAGIKNSKRVIISNAGHIVPMEQPEEFNNLVLDFVKEVKFLGVLYKKGVAEAVKVYKNAKSRNDKSVFFKENTVNVIGYKYLLRGNIHDAIELFKINVLAYPESWNTYDSLAEAYVIKGEKGLAIKNYKKALKLNPDNTNAKTKLAELEK